MNTRHSIMYSIMTVVLIAMPVGVSTSDAAPLSRDFVAYAIPLSGITIDGKLDDWPANRLDYPITWPYTGRPDDSHDFSATFSAGYNLAQNLLYVVVVVRDESILVEEPPWWNRQDACEVYLASRPGVVDQYVLAPTSGMDIRPERSGNPMSLKQQIEGTRTRGAYRKTAEGVIYEWALDLTPYHAATGGKLGFDIAICDLDDDESFTWMSWTPGVEKHSDRMRTGTLVFTKTGERMVQLSGSAHYADGDAAPFTLLGISQGSRPITYTATDGEGTYRIWLPPGEGYQVTTYSPREGGGLRARGNSSITLTSEPVSCDVEVPQRETSERGAWAPEWRGNDSQRVGVGKPVVIKEGEVVGSAVSIGNNVTVLGETEEAVAIGGNVTIGPGGHVYQTVVTIGGEVKMDSTASTPPHVVEMPSIGSKFLWGILPAILFGAQLAGALAAAKVVIGILYKIIVLLVLLALGALVVTFLPTRFDTITKTIRHDPWRSAGVGVLGFLCIVPLMILVAITLIGIPLIPLIGIAIVVSIFLGYLAVSVAVGRELPLDAKWKTTFWTLALGIVILTLVNAIPFIGWLTWMATMVVGFGATLLSRFGRVQREG